MTNLDNLTEEFAKDMAKADFTKPKAQSNPLRPGSPAMGVNNPKPTGPYSELSDILKKAFEQAATGKGHERHAASPVGMLPWVQQPILANARQVGPAGPAQQIMKKAGESVGMANNFNFGGAKAEALGCIVYAAALYRLYEEMEQANGAR